MDILEIISESEEIAREISEISDKASKKERYRRLKELRNNYTTPLARAKADYYIKMVRLKRRKLRNRILLAAFSLACLVFTLCRVWWYHHPESNPLPETHFTIVDFINAAFLLPVIAVAWWGVKKAINRIKGNKL